MGTIPTIATWPAGGALTSSYLNSIKAASDFWALTPRCYAYRTTALSLATSGTFGVMVLDAEVYDIVQSGDTPSHDLSTDASRIVVRTAGKYEISGAVEFSSNATGARTVKVNLNAAANESAGTLLVTQTQGAVTGAVTSVALPTVEVALAVGDYIEMFARQTSGGSLALGFGQAQTWLRLKLTGS